jgi:hypothetical protein
VESHPAVLLPDRPWAVLLPDRPWAVLLPDRPWALLLPDRPWGERPLRPLGDLLDRRRDALLGVGGKGPKSSESSSLSVPWLRLLLADEDFFLALPCFTFRSAPTRTSSDLPSGRVPTGEVFPLGGV